MCDCECKNCKIASNIFGIPGHEFHVCLRDEKKEVMLLTAPNNVSMCTPAGTYYKCRKCKGVFEATVVPKGFSIHHCLYCSSSDIEEMAV